MAKKHRDADRGDLFHYIRIVIGILTVTLVVLACYFGYCLGREIFTDEAKTTWRTDHITYTLTVRKGEGSIAVGRDLKENGIIRNALAFAIQTKVYQTKIEAGEYVVSSRQSSKAIAKYLNDEYVRAHSEETK